MSEEDAEKFLDGLSRHGVYDKMDRYRDFRTVFSSDQGRRVLFEIMRHGGLDRSPVSPAIPIDTSRVMFNLGKRFLAQAIMDIMHDEPQDQPNRQIRKE